VHPNETQPFSIYTDASRIAIGGVLMQADEEGNPQIISTTSRVLMEYTSVFRVPTPNTLYSIPMLYVSKVLKPYYEY
jgi:hypothetical protein